MAADRIAGVIDNQQRATLAGHINPRISAAQDQGAVDGSMELPYVTLVLKPSAAQQADLDQFAAHLQDPASPDYHHWLTPAQYADRFGASQADMAKITAWLTQNGLTVKSVARGRNVIAFSGTAQHINNVFGAGIHRYLLGGKLHYANSADPSVPAALDGVVLAVHGLTDLTMKPRLVRSMKPSYTTGTGTHQLGPGDLAAIYDITPLYNAGITGKGQTLAVVGQTDIVMSDIQQFRNYFELSANNPTVTLVPGSPDPGTQDASGDLGEADLDLELAGSVARDATILFINSNDVMNSLQYAIDQKVAPVITTSYGDCELDTGSSDAHFMETLATQANTQGQTIFAASGDAGAADCYGIGDGPAIDQALSVDLPGALPQVTSVGGTEFHEGSATYWNSKNSASESSAQRYIPEVAWNDSASDGQPASSGGGASAFFAKPSWQTGTGVPNDGARDVPDVSLSASADHDAYQIVSSGQFQLVGGTSAGGPQMAGVAALLNQYLIANGYQSAAGLGNINPTLYALASTSGVFHDITAGNNIVTPCETVRTCTATAIGYSAGAGYDLATGLGSPDVYNLVTSWHSRLVSNRESVSMKLAASAGSIAFTGSTVLTATVTSTNGGTPSGTVSFSIGTNTLGAATLAGSGETATAKLTLSGVQLAAGANTLTATYSGDNSYYSETATAGVTENTASNGAPVVGGVTNAASYAQAFAPGAIISVFGTNLAPVTTSSLTIPLPEMLGGTSVTINGTAAPLYYISSTQLNIQIPYQTAAGSANLILTNNGKSTNYTFQVTAAAPGIFTFDNGAPVPFSTASRGQVLTMYVTGAGAVSPAVATGNVPTGAALASLPAPTGRVTLAVGGVNSTLNFVGIPSWSIGVVQINYTVPTNAPLGSQPVVVTVGGVQSAATHLTVTN